MQIAIWRSFQGGNIRRTAPVLVFDHPDCSKLPTVRPESVEGLDELIPIPNHYSSNLPSFPRRRESNFRRANLDSRLRGNDGAIIDLLL